MYIRALKNPGCMVIHVYQSSQKPWLYGYIHVYQTANNPGYMVIHVYQSSQKPWLYGNTCISELSKTLVVW